MTLAHTLPASGTRMSDDATTLNYATPRATSAESTRAFIAHAKLIGFLTFISRVLGMARESVAANYFGAGAIWSAFTVAFTIPNLFRKLFGEGALSAAFIPLYAQAVKKGDGSTDTASIESANGFANASVNLLCAMLITLTVVGELGLWIATMTLKMRSETLLAVKLTAVMLPYVLLVCGQAFLGGILQVHRRFGATAAVPILLNLVLIVAIVSGARMFNLTTPAGQTKGVYWLAVSVLVSGLVQVIVLIPSLRAAGFAFHPVLHFWTPQVRRMLKLTLPVALGAGVLQISVLMDKGISFLLAASPDASHFHLFGRTIRYPMEEGAAARLNWAQYLYQFPLGIFAIALATAIFPKLAGDALDHGREQFRAVLRRGIEASLFIGLPASVGLMIVARPAVALLFERGNFTPHDTELVARSTILYSAAIWAFSLQQILNRAYYALHDTKTPLVLGIANLVLNVVVEIPLLWTPMAESAMAAGTLVAFAVQAVVMVFLLNQRSGGLNLSRSIAPIVKMIIASLVMGLACLAVRYIPHYPTGSTKVAWAMQLSILMGVGGVVYLAMCGAMGIHVLEHLKPRAK